MPFTLAAAVLLSAPLSPQGVSVDPLEFAWLVEPLASAVLDSRGSTRVRMGPRMLLDGRILLDLGMLLNWPSNFDPIVDTLGGNGWVSIVSGMPFVHVRVGDPATYPPGPSSPAVVQAHRALIWDGRTAPPHLSSGGEYRFWNPTWKSDRYAVMEFRIERNFVIERSGILRIRTDGRGNVLDEALVLENGSWSPTVSAPIWGAQPSISPDGRVLVLIGYDVGGQTHGALWLDGQVVLRDGDALLNSTLIVDRVGANGMSGDLNSSGSWACVVRLSNGSLGIVSDGRLIFDGAQPGFSTGGALFDQMHNVLVTEDGRVLWVAKASSITAQTRAWLLADGMPIYEPGVDLFGGSAVGIPDYSVGKWRFADPEGAFATTRTQVTPPLPSGSWVELVIPLMRSQQLCDGPPSSFGSDPTVEYLGSTYVDVEKRYLVARGLPANATVLWLQSLLPGSIPLPAAGQGTICLGPPIARQAAITDGHGTVTGPAALMAQSGRQHYQVWYRDVDVPGGAPTSRVSDAVVVDLR